MNTNQRKTIGLIILEDMITKKLVRCECFSMTGNSICISYSLHNLILGSIINLLSIFEARSKNNRFDITALFNINRSIKNYQLTILINFVVTPSEITCKDFM